MCVQHIESRLFHRVKLNQLSNHQFWNLCQGSLFVSIELYWEISISIVLLCITLSIVYVILCNRDFPFSFLVSVKSLNHEHVIFRKGRDCGFTQSHSGFEDRQECCHCCYLGMEAKRRGTKCQSSLLGYPCQRAFFKCCLSTGTTILFWKYLLQAQWNDIVRCLPHWVG